MFLVIVLFKTLAAIAKDHNNQNCQGETKWNAHKIKKNYNGLLTSLSLRLSSKGKKLRSAWIVNFE